jgi:hypothetical protein
LLVNVLQKLVHKVIIWGLARLAKPIYRLLVKSGCVTAMGLPFAKYQASVELCVVKDDVKLTDEEGGRFY